MEERLNRRGLQFTQVNEQLGMILIKAKSINYSLICSHASVENKEDTPKMFFSNTWGALVSIYLSWLFHLHKGKRVIVFGPNVSK